MKKLLVLLPLMLLAACAITETSSVGKDFNAAQREKIQKNVTTQKQVLTLLGEPMDKKFSQNGKEEWIYLLSAAKVKFNPWVNKAKGMNHVKKLVVLFNDNNTVKNYLFSEKDVPSTAKIRR